MSPSLTLLQQPTTLITAIVVVVTTAMIVSPKWLHWWSDWKKWQANQKVSSATEGGTINSQPFTKSPQRRIWSVPGFWGMVADLLIGSGALSLLFVATADDSPATVGRAAWLVMLGATWIVSALRRW